ncbi:unnamed protein product [Ceutorhynchus assimilis]|uniref:Uncharacterized protein n=1 Tax=Ceutorhynchus assimilis TaxID=467358 RepID=A0A9N9MXX4_9CUCU|nr:unnamed protein product [Ceutorhynchus assimilis]
MAHYLNFAMRNMVGVLIVFVLVICHTQARSGCAIFGHSCYGGIGKRAELADTNEESTNQKNELSTGLYPESSQNYIPRPFSVSPEQYERMNKYINEWILNYMRNREEYLRKEEGFDRE